MAAAYEGNTALGSILQFVAYDPSRYDPSTDYFQAVAIKYWVLGDFVFSESQYEAFNSFYPSYYGDAWDGLEFVDVSSGASIDYSFNPGGDFLWALHLETFAVFDATEQNVSATVNFSHTVNASFQGPDGAITYSESGLFPGTLAVTAVPEPASWALLIGGLGLVGGAMRRRPNAVAV